MRHHKRLSAQRWGASLHPGNTATCHNSELSKRAGRWGPQPLSHLIPHLPFQGRPCGLVTPLQTLLNPESSIFKSPPWHCASGWQSHPRQGDPAEMRLWCGGSAWGSVSCPEGSWKPPSTGPTCVPMSTEHLCAFREQPGHSLPHCFPTSERTVCDLDVLPCVATSRLPAVWDEETVSTTSEKVVPGLKAPGKRD